MNSEFVISSNRKDANKNAVKILEAAKKIFSQKGLDATMEEVALEANVGVGTLYRRFNNKTQLANAVANEVISDIYNEQVGILKSNQSTVDKVYQIFDCYGKITQKYGEIHPMIVELLVTDKGDKEFKETFLSHLKQLYAEVIEHGQKEGVFRDGDPRLYEIFFHNMINPQIVNQVAEIMPLEKVPQFLADLALHGVLKK
ncbi:TetR/AcrR family transcriptional regulator [Neobacillus drentensis]|uniref:TetR/AcrR family transcriptional regulator n=1 Tax=Neobacillus TaxID=2675232 RepID=UPI003000BEFB